jgi:ABC-2 type transport system ATP-binding protein
MSSHLLNEVQDVCDEVAMIDHGKLLVYDSLSNVTRRSSSDGENVVEVELSRDIDERTVNNDIASLTNVSSAERYDPRKIRVHFSGGVQNQERLLLDLANMKIGMVSFHSSASALEDTYLKLIKDTL